MDFRPAKTQEEAVEKNMANLIEYMTKSLLPRLIIERPDLFQLMPNCWQYRLIHNAPGEEW